MLTVLLISGVLTPLLLLATRAQAASSGVPPASVRAALRHVVVKPGQSLWSIAVQAAPQADPRMISRQIIQLNALSSDVVVPGESLWVPRG